MIVNMKIYTAGPDVFYSNAVQRFKECRAIAEEHGHTALTPFDNDVDLLAPNAARLIYESNVSLIRECDVVLANCDNFRGMEPDSGTCFEIGFAVALGKRVIAYYQTPAGKTLIERLGAGTIEGTVVEGFGLPLNLMLAMSSTVIEGSFEDAVKLV